jgi:hypothetical protein
VHDAALTAQTEDAAILCPRVASSKRIKDSRYAGMPQTKRAVDSLFKFVAHVAAV